MFAPLYTGLMQLHAQSPIVHRFCQILVDQATNDATKNAEDVPKILIATGDLDATQQILSIGFPASALTVLSSDPKHCVRFREQGLEPESKDLRLWTPQSSQWDAIWAPGIFLEDTTTQRVLATLFRGMKPKGLLWVDWSGPHWKASTAHPLLRQSGFDVILEASLPTRQGVFARRVG